MENKNNLHIFTIDFESEEDRCTYKGQFTCKKPSVLDKSKIGVKHAQLNGGRTLIRENGKVVAGDIDEMTDFINYIFAFLEFTLIQKPQWWDLNTITDINLVIKVYEEVDKFIGSFRPKTEGTKEERTTESKEPNNRGPIEAMVDEKILAALDG